MLGSTIDKHGCLQDRCHAQTTTRETSCSLVQAETVLRLPKYPRILARNLTHRSPHKSHPQRLQHLRLPPPINPLHPLRRPRIQILRQHILPLRLNHPMPLPGSPHPHPQLRTFGILQQAQHILQGLTPPLRQLLLHDGKLQPSQARPLPRLQRREEPLDVIGGAVVPFVEIEAVDGEGDRGGFLVDLPTGEEQVRVDGADEDGVVGRLGGHVEGCREG